MSKNYPPAYLRYFKARLLNFTRPGFWGTGLILVVIGFVIKEYWKNPNFLSVFQSGVDNELSQNSNLSDEDKAIAADIDNLPVLFSESKQTDIETNNLQSSGKRAKQKPLSSIENFQRKANTQNVNSVSNSIPNLIKDIPSRKIDNPFITRANNLLSLKSIGENTSYSNSSGSILGIFNQQNSNVAAGINQNELARFSEYPLKTQIDRISNNNTQIQNQNSNLGILAHPNLQKSLGNKSNNLNVNSEFSKNFITNQVNRQNSNSFQNNQLSNNNTSPVINQSQNIYTQYSNTNLNRFNIKGQQDRIQRYVDNRNNLQQPIERRQAIFYNSGSVTKQLNTIPNTPSLSINPNAYNPTYYNLNRGINTRQNINMNQNINQSTYNNNRQTITNPYINRAHYNYQSPQYNYSQPRVNNTNRVTINGRSYSYP